MFIDDEQKKPEKPEKLFVDNFVPTIEKFVEFCNDNTLLKNKESKSEIKTHYFSFFSS